MLSHETVSLTFSKNLAGLPVFRTDRMSLLSPLDLNSPIYKKENNTDLYFIVKLFIKFL